MSPVTQAAVLVAFPVAASAAGAAASLRFAPGPKVVSGIQHFAAGVVIAALVGEVLPDLRHEGQLPAAALGFTLGAAVVLALAAWGRRLDQKAEANPTDDASPVPGPPGATLAALPVGMLAAVGIDLLIDGLLVGLGATLGAKQGLIITIALTLEILFLVPVPCGRVQRGRPQRTPSRPAVHRPRLTDCGGRDHRRRSPGRSRIGHAGSGARLRRGEPCSTSPWKNCWSKHTSKPRRPPWPRCSSSDSSSSMCWPNSAADPVMVTPVHLPHTTVLRRLPLCETSEQPPPKGMKGQTAHRSGLDIGWPHLPELPRFGRPARLRCTHSFVPLLCRWHP